MTTEPDMAPAVAAEPMAFSFGNPEPVLGGRAGLLEHMACWNNGRWYETPTPMEGLSRAAKVSSHHGSAMFYKVGQLVRDFIPHPLLSRETFEGMALDDQVLANYYVERVNNRLGGSMPLRRSLAKYTRRGVKDGEFFFVQNWANEHAFKPGAVFHGRRPGIDQEIYGEPEYLSALQSALLSEDAGLYRRRYYLNGSHSGFIMYVTDALSTTDADAIRHALKGAKGPGNFRNLFVHSPTGKEKGIQLLHPAEAAAKDNFSDIKNVTRDDILAVHRVYPQLLGVVPSNAGGFGSVKEAAEIFYETETVPLQNRFKALNEWMGDEVVRFRARAKSPA
ncbi:Phage portal protein [compost metagenome]